MHFRLAAQAMRDRRFGSASLSLTPRLHVPTKELNQGKSVMVRYDPHDPWQSVLEPGPTDEWEKAMTICVIGLLLGGFLLFLAGSGA